jgi:ABC transporter substrate binding protein
MGRIRSLGLKLPSMCERSGSPLLPAAAVLPQCKAHALSLIRRIECTFSERSDSICASSWLARNDPMRRREFITVLGGVAAWPLAARGQQAGRPPIIGFLGGQSPSAMGHLVAAFVQRLRELGWIEGRNVAIEHRWIEGRNERGAAEIAAELVRLKVDVIVAGGTTSVVAAKQATSLIPIVFVAGDPVGTGLVASLARPGGNVTVLSNQSIDIAPNGWSYCARWCPVFGGWLFSSIWPVPHRCWRCVHIFPEPMRELKSGAKIFVAGAAKKEDGTLEAASISVGRDGLTPPM